MPRAVFPEFEIAELARRARKANGPLMTLLQKLGGTLEGQLGLLPGPARKQMEAGMEQGELLQQFEVAYLTDLMTKFCAQFDCEGAAPKGDAAGKPSRR